MKFFSRPVSHEPVSVVSPDVATRLEEVTAKLESMVELLHQRIGKYEERAENDD